ncbi:PKD-like family lipoprotein [Sphingobacterium hungaricum]
MKILKYFLIIALFMSSCSPDLGNYIYSDENTITISGVKEGLTASSRVYDLVYGDTLILEPSVSGLLSKDDMTNLSFLWVISEDTVSTTKNLSYKTDKFGINYGSFYVTDNLSGIKTVYSFILNVTNVYNRGYYILTQNDDGDAVFYAKSAIDTSKALEQVNIPDVENLGKNPVSVSGIRLKDGNNQYYYHLYLTIKDAEFNVMNIDTREFKPIYRYNSATTTEAMNFQPTQLFNEATTGGSKAYVVSNGKFHVMENGIVGVEKFNTDPLDYKVEPGDLYKCVLFGGYLISLYDSNNEKVRILFNSFGVFDDYNYSFDSYITNKSTLGHDFLYGMNTYITGVPDFYYLTKKDNKLYLFKSAFNFLFVPSDLSQFAVSDLSSIGSSPDKITDIYYDPSNYWFISIGRTIYRASYLGLSFQEYIKLPDDGSGDIVKFMAATPSPNRFLISTYNASSTKEKKGSVYIYDIAKAKVTNTMLYSTEKAVSVFVGDQ